MSLLSYALIVAMSFLQAGHVAVDPDPYGSVFFVYVDPYLRNLRGSGSGSRD